VGKVAGQVDGGHSTTPELAKHRILVGDGCLQSLEPAIRRGGADDVFVWWPRLA